MFLDVPANPFNPFRAILHSTQGSEAPVGVPHAGEQQGSETALPFRQKPCGQLQAMLVFRLPHAVVCLNRGWLETVGNQHVFHGLPFTHDLP